MPYGIFLLKILSTLDTCYFKASGAIELEPKRIEYLIIYAPWYISQ